MSKNVNYKEGKKLVFGGDKARGDWVAVKIPWFNMSKTTTVMVMIEFQWNNNST